MYNQYNDYQNYYYPAQIFALKEQEKNEIKLVGRVAGICILAYVVLQFVLFFPFYIPSLAKIYDESTLLQNAVSIVFSIVSLLLPFFIGGLYLKKRTGVDFAPLEKTPYPVAAVFLVFAGLFVCMLGDFATTWIGDFFAGIGIEFTSPDMEVSKSLLDRIVYTVSVALVAPLCEEIAIRGVVMQPLRRYGDLFAIIISAAVFGVLHGNLVQAPFAFIAGLGMGYAACVTGTLWTSIIIHFLNNLYACVMLFASEDMQPDAFARFYNLTLYSICIIGALCVLGYIFLGKRGRLYRSQTVSGTGAKTGAFFITVPMIIALVIMLVITSFYVKIG